MPKNVHGECNNGGGGGGGSPPAERQPVLTLRPWAMASWSPCPGINDNNIDLPVYSPHNVLDPRPRSRARGQDCPGEAFAAGWDSTASSSSSAATSSPNSAVTSSRSRSSLSPLSSAVASPSSSPNYAVTATTCFLNSVSVNEMFLILYGAATLTFAMWNNDIESHSTSTHTMVHFVIFLKGMVRLYMSRVQLQGNLDHLWRRWIGTEFCWDVLLWSDILSGGLLGWSAPYRLMNSTVTASLVGLLFSTFFFGTSDLVFNLITKVKNLASAILLILASGYRCLKRKVGLLGLLLLALLVFGGIHLTSDNRGSEIKLVNNYKHSHDRMLLSIRHETTEGSVGKHRGIINDDLRLTAENADGSGQGQKALPHWTSNRNSNQSGEVYDDKSAMQNRPGNQSGEVCDDKSAMQNGPLPHMSAHKLIKTVVVSSIAVASALVVVCYIFVLLWRKCGNRAQTNAPQPQLELCRVSGPRPFQYDELAAATNNFADENKLGQGGFGPVYQGFLRDPDRHVAIKLLLSAESSWQGKREFEAEVQVLTQVRHRNIVQLVGWCQSNEGLLLVYELMAQGSLDKHLHNPLRILSWQLRYKIILDLGSALLYLHRCCDKCIVHSDIKPENVMLDASFNAKLGDFGTARPVEHGADPRTTEIVAGTRGYIDPEFVTSRLRCPDADIYSFGVALLEIASGERPASRQPNGASALLLWVRSLYDRGMVLDAADGKLNGNFDRQQMERVLVTALWCAHHDPSQRPSIEQAMDVLRCVDAALPVLPATRDAQQVRIMEELAYGDLTGTCYLTSKEDSSAYLLAQE